MSIVWVIDDDKSIRWVLEKALTKANINTRIFDNASKALECLKTDVPDAIISDIRMPHMDGFEFLKKAKHINEHVPIIIMTAHSDLESAVSSYQKGAFEYLPKPFDIDEATALIQRAITHYKELIAQQPEPETERQVDGIIGEAPAMQEVFRAIGRLSQSHITVLINGESGTGKELVANALHTHSPRSNRPFIALNMAAIPKDLIESELFGHEKGAFTGAGGQRTGRFEQANGGTLFLDEIGDMPGETQTRLLRVLADGEFYRVGGTTPIKVDVRIIAATHQDLESLVRQGKFRDDLFHRLNVIRIHIPRLAERREDIPKLLQYFLQRSANELNVDNKILKPEAEHFLSQLDWPGNVRQLENTCRWITVMASGREVLINDLPPELLDGDNAAPQPKTDWEQALRMWADAQLNQGGDNILDAALPAFERCMIESALQYTGGRRKDAAQRLGWGRNTLTRKIKELKLDLIDDPEH